jgi:tRNA(Arg) A34 adenosine deaminase TadA
MASALTSISPAERVALDAAIQQAEKSLSEGGIPIGSVLMHPSGEIVARGHNLRVQSGDTTAHAETACIRSAGRRRDWHTLTLVSTLSPCAMCSGTASSTRSRASSSAKILPSWAAKTGCELRASRSRWFTIRAASQSCATSSPLAPTCGTKTSGFHRPDNSVPIGHSILL